MAEEVNQPAGASPGSDHQEKDLLTIARGGGIAFIGSLFTRALGYVFTVVMVWGLGGEAFGLFTLAGANVNFIGVLTQLGLDRGVIRFGAMRSADGEYSNVHKVTMIALGISLPVGVLFLLILLFAADQIAVGIFNKPELAYLLRVMAFNIPVVSAQTMLLAATQSRQRIGYSSIVLVLENLLSIIFAWILFGLGYGLQVVAVSYVVSYALGSLLALYFYLRLIPTHPHQPQPIAAKEMMKFSIPLSMTQWIQLANERTEVFFLGLMPGAVNVGIYNVAWRLAGLESIFSESLNQIFAPFSSDLSHRRAIKRLEDLYKTTAKWTFTGAFILFLVFTLFAARIMHIFDPAFVVGVNVLIALGFAQLISAMTGSCGTVLIMSGRSDLSLLNTVLLLVLSVALDWLLIPPYGLPGAALAGSATVIVINLLRVVEVWYTLNIHPFQRTLYKPVLAGLASCALVYGLRSVSGLDSLWADAGFSLLMGILYIAGIYLLKLDEDDSFVLGVLRRKLPGAKAA